MKARAGWGSGGHPVQGAIQVARAAAPRGDYFVLTAMLQNRTYRTTTAKRPGQAEGSSLSRLSNLTLFVSVRASAAAPHVASMARCGPSPHEAASRCWWRSVGGADDISYLNSASGIPEVRHAEDLLTDDLPAITDQPRDHHCARRVWFRSQGEGLPAGSAATQVSARSCRHARREPTRRAPEPRPPGRQRRRVDAMFVRRTTQDSL